MMRLIKRIMRFSRVMNRSVSFIPPGRPCILDSPQIPFRFRSVFDFNLIRTSTVAGDNMETVPKVLQYDVHGAVDNVGGLRRVLERDRSF